MRVPRFPATGYKIDECSRFANQGFRGELKRGPLQSRRREAIAFSSVSQSANSGRGVIGAGRQEHREIGVIAEFLPKFA
jgi:hypothetical protein